MKRFFFFMAMTVFIAINASSQNWLNKALKKVDNVLNEVNGTLSGDNNQQVKPVEATSDKKEEAAPQIEQVQQLQEKAIPQLFEPIYIGLNGKFTSVEITNKQLGSVEAYTFDNLGRLLEKRVYSNATKRTLIAKDSYIRNSAGDLIETYSGFNLNDNHYIGETRWRMIEKNGNKERWQEIKDDWWGAKYKDIEYKDNQRRTLSFVIQKKNGERSNLEFVVSTFNNRGQILTELSDTGPNNPKNTTIRTYNDKGHLLKEDYEQVFSDGTINKVENASYTINKEDELGNPLQVTDNDKKIKIYKYFK